MQKTKNSQASAKSTLKFRSPINGAFPSVSPKIISSPMRGNSKSKKQSKIQTDLNSLDDEDYIRATHNLSPHYYGSNE